MALLGLDFIDTVHNGGNKNKKNRLKIDAKYFYTNLDESF